MEQQQKRLREIDFLRGIAIILVIFRHQFVFEKTQQVGWIGVDLFFVLSGFLVSGLVFKEFQRTGTFAPGRFLIRRGFKIYPLYYIFFLISLIPVFFKYDPDWETAIAEIFFVQNYTNGYGYVIGASWSLAIEEHFYFAFALWFVWMLRRGGSFEPPKKGMHNIEYGILIIFCLCLGLRILTRLYFEVHARHFTMTHLRMDSLLAGVLLSYWYYFRRELLQKTYDRIKNIFWVVIPLCLCWTPFYEPLESFFVMTLGMSLLYIGFGSLLLIFLMDPRINKRLNRVLTPVVVDSISKIGYSSYAIYLLHIGVIKAIDKFNYRFEIWRSNEMIFLFVLAISVGLGILATNTIERYFLKLREKYYPAGEKH